VRLLLALGLLGGLAWLSGWLKTLYYFAAFGVDLGLLQLTTADYLRESWFVLQNLAFFLLMWWIALRTRSRWVLALACVYSLLPIATHYAFAFDGAWADALIRYRHTLLKLVPFAVLVLAWLVLRGRRQALRTLAWPFGRAATLLAGLVVVSWTISAAKHFGSFDAQRALRDPDRFLSRVRVEPALRPAGDWYLIAAGAAEVVLWRRPAAGEPDDSVHVAVLRRSNLEAFELQRRGQIQPGNQFF
jgi:hypothetical protein